MTAPTVILCPLYNGQQFFDNNGQMLNGGKIAFYQAGSWSIPQSTYTDDTGLDVNSNPIVLGSNGRLKPGVAIWLDASLVYNTVLYQPDGVTVINSVADVVGTYNFANVSILPIPYADAGGSADAVTATYTVSSAVLIDGYTLIVGIASLNLTTTPTFAPTLNGITQTARVIVKFVGNVEVPLVAGELQGDAELKYDFPNSVWILQNPDPTVTLAPLETVPISSGGTGQTLSQTAANALTNRLSTITTSATPTPAADITDTFTVTALAANATFGAPTYTTTPVDGQCLLIRIKDNGTSQTLAWNAIYRAVGITLPTTTVISKSLYVAAFYNAVDGTWDVVGVSQQ